MFFRDLGDAHLAQGKQKPGEPCPVALSWRRLTSLAELNRTARRQQPIVWHAHPISDLHFKQKMPGSRFDISQKRSTNGKGCWGDS